MSSNVNLGLKLFETAETFKMGGHVVIKIQAVFKSSEVNSFVQNLS
jgi:hypothetical protein